MQGTLSGLTWLWTNLIERYCKRYHVTEDEFFELDEKYHILEWIEECKDLFNDMTWTRGVIAIKKYVEDKEKDEQV